MAEGNQNLVEEVRVLEERLEQVRRALTGSGETVPPDRELMQEVVRGRMREAEPPSPAGVATPYTSPVPPAAQVSPPHDEAVELQDFVAVAFEKGIPDAVKLVRRTGNAHLLDALHDLLVDRFFEELVKRGKIKA
ncbi:MAG: hypothetical protein HYS57_01135 [Parcubacteria group bacterium]|nr:hypothetical protein [Parcubacteria group bacterium]